MPQRREASEPAADDAADLVTGADKARALAGELEALQHRILSEPGAEDALRRRLAEIQVTLANLLALPPQGALSPDRVLSLLKDRP